MHDDGRPISRTHLPTTAQVWRHPNEKSKSAQRQTTSLFCKVVVVLLLILLQLFLSNTGMTIITVVVVVVGRAAHGRRDGTPPCAPEGRSPSGAAAAAARRTRRTRPQSWRRPPVTRTHARAQQGRWGENHTRHHQHNTHARQTGTSSHARDSWHSYQYSRKPSGRTRERIY
jgi:hypothetical protein